LPAQSEHIKHGLGASSDRLAEFNQALYARGIQAHLSKWAELPADAHWEFDHWILWLHRDSWILARLLASADAQGRDAFPFVVAAEVRGADWQRALPALVP